MVKLQVVALLTIFVAALESIVISLLSLPGKEKTIAGVRPLCTLYDHSTESG